ncbi:MAG: hypothetical protein ABH983_01630 [Candidatus Micrarchaeota archaeon]|nr:hypothetical protein [Candidatus Micrarchaeota archaeon]
MMPPVCKICNKDFRNEEECGLLHFKKTEKDDEFDRKCEEDGFVGHPPYAAWFCKEHYEEAKKLINLTLDEAMEILRKKFDS